MQHPHQTASGVVSESPLVLTDAVTEDGVVGHSVVFTYTEDWARRGFLGVKAK